MDQTDIQYKSNFARELQQSQHTHYPIEYTPQKAISHVPQKAISHVPQQVISHIPQQAISNTQYPVINHTHKKFYKM